MTSPLARLVSATRTFSRCSGACLGGMMLTALLAAGCGSSDGVSGVSGLSGEQARTLSSVVATSGSQDSIAERRVVRTTTTTSTTSTTSAVASGRNWAGVRSFACQFNELDLVTALSSNFDLLVTDYSSDGSDAGRYTATEVRQLQAGGKRRVVAYLSVGEAENYRFYWKRSWSPGSPGWLGPENPDWQGNYKVKYWNAAWKSTLYGSPTAYLDKIIAAGYDGVFLDVVDAYEFWEDQGRGSAGADMATLVKELTAYARTHGGGADFGVFLNGGEGLIGDTALLSTITGLAKEDMFFGLDGLGVPTDPAFTKAEQAMLKPAVDAKKLILSIDYSASVSDRSTAHLRAAASGYLEYVSSSLGLDQLIAQLF